VPIRRNMKLINDIKESYSELVYKVSWPTQKQLISSSVLVLIASIIIAVFIWVVDKVFNLLMELIYSISF
jgi:preprotein translocase subunit SecE